MQKIHWCDLKGIEFTLQNNWTIASIAINEKALSLAGSAPFLVVFNVPEPATEPEQNKQAEAEQHETAEKPRIKANPVFLFVWLCLLFIWGFYAGMLAERLVGK